MPNKVVQISKIGTVTFSKNRRSKNIKISVKPDQSVLVSFPFFVSSKEVVAFVIKNEEWIRRQQQKFKTNKSAVANGSLIKTKLHELHFLNSEKNKTIVEGNRIQIHLDEFESERSREYIEKIMTEVYRYEAKILLPPRLEELANKYGFQFNNVTIRNNKRNWGSCSSKNNISLNLQMMKLPDKLIDYILLHELVHTEIKNHSPKFWERLNEVTGNEARILAKQVRQYSTYSL